MHCRIEAGLRPYSAPRTVCSGQRYTVILRPHLHTRTAPAPRCRPLLTCALVWIAPPPRTNQRRADDQAGLVGARAAPAPAPARRALAGGYCSCRGGACPWLWLPSCQWWWRSASSWRVVSALLPLPRWRRHALHACTALHVSRLGAGAASASPPILVAPRLARLLLQTDASSLKDFGHKLLQDEYTKFN
jgi:hypothetical protein